MVVMSCVARLLGKVARVFIETGNTRVLGNVVPVCIETGNTGPLGNAVQGFVETSNTGFPVTKGSWVNVVRGLYGDR